MTSLMIITGYTALLGAVAGRHAYTIASSVRRFLDAVTFPHPIQPSWQRDMVILTRARA